MTAHNSIQKVGRNRIEALLEKLEELAIPREFIALREKKDRVDAFLGKNLTPAEKQITLWVEDPQDTALRALTDGENGAELRVLELLSALVLTGKKINQDFQRVANAIVAQSVLVGKLPSKPKGRPKSDDNDVARNVANDYYEMRDAGASYAATVAGLAVKYHKDERHIMRLVHLGKRYFFPSKLDREFWRNLYRNMPPDSFEMFEQISQDRAREYQQVKEGAMRHDFIGELHDLIVAELKRKTFTDMKST